MSTPKKSVLFVCLGNICRSPMAEAVFLDLIAKKGCTNLWTVDSAAVIDYHVGKGPERRTLSTLKGHGITTYHHTVRQVVGRDFNQFDFIFGMDDANIADLQSMVSGSCKAKIGLLGAYDPQGVRIIPDPYYESGVQLFEQVYEQCLRCCTAFLEKESG